MREAGLATAFESVTFMNFVFRALAALPWAAPLIIPWLAKRLLVLNVVREAPGALGS